MELVCFGDSLTDCGRNFENWPLGDGYVKMAAEALAENGWRTSNRGVDGFTVRRVLEYAGKDSFTGDADILTVLVGINDVGLMMNTGRTEEQRKAMMVRFFEDYEKLLNMFVVERLISEKKVVLMEPFVFSWPAEFRNWIPIVEEMSQGISELAGIYHTKFMPLQERLNREAKEYGVNSLTVDGIHLTRFGHSILAEELINLLQKEFIAD